MTKKRDDLVRKNAQNREFVYLDEVSVESLLASVDGEILVQQTKTHSKTSESGIGGSLTSNTPFGKASFSPTLKRATGTEVQELRKSVAQSAFARFRAKNLLKFALRPLDSAKASKRRMRSLSNLDPKTLRRLGQGLPLSELKRGDLIELETDLIAADIFKARTAVSAVTEVVEAYPSFLTIEVRDALKNARPLTALIDSLNGNAIPVVGERPSLRVVDVDGVPWIVVTSSALPESSQPQIVLESVAREPWFWGDVGRILFRSTRFRMLCRVVNPELTGAEPGSYVGTILKTIDDGLANTVDSFGSMFLGALRQGHKQATGSRRPVGPDPALLAYFEATVPPSEESETTMRPRLPDQFTAIRMQDLSVDLQTQVFRAVDEAVSSHLDEDALAVIRQDVRNEWGLWPWSPVANVDPESPVTAPAVRHLEVAIVAVYW